MQTFFELSKKDGQSSNKPLKNNQEPTTFKRTIKRHRHLLAQLDNPVTEPLNIPYKNFVIPSLKVCICAYRPKKINKNQAYPTILFIPGTAFVGSENAFTHVICTYLAKLSSCQVLLIKHCLAPEHSPSEMYRNILEQLKYIHQNPMLFDSHPKKRMLMGYSSGAYFTAWLNLTKDLKKLGICWTSLISPLTDLTRSLKTYNEFEKRDKKITLPFVKWFLNHYLKKMTLKDIKKISPHWLPLPSLFQAQPSDIFFDHNDQFRGDSEAYYKKMKNHTTTTRIKVKSNHGHFWYHSFTIECIAERLKYLFGIYQVPKQPNTYIKFDQNDPKKITINGFQCSFFQKVASTHKTQQSEALTNSLSF